LKERKTRIVLAEVPAVNGNAGQSNY